MDMPRKPNYKDKSLSLTKKARHSFLEYAAATPTEAVTMRNAPHIIMERNTVWFTPSILKKSFDIA